MESQTELLARLTKKKKGQRQKDRGRKVGRNLKYYGVIHTQTLYRSRNQREKNKVRKAAKRLHRLALAAARRERNATD